MSTRNATAKWNGTLKEGKGEMAFTGYNGPFTWASRFADGKETNPEELVGAAIAGCYSMFLSALISGKDMKPDSIHTTAAVVLEKDETGPLITSITLNCEAAVPGLDQALFKELTATAKKNCPISRLYAGTRIELNAKLLQMN